MSRASQLRAIPWVLGVCLLVGAVAGADKLLHPADSAAGGPPAPAPSPTLPGGVVVIGTADSDPPPVQVGPPALAAMAKVTQVLVKEGQEVKVGDPLVQFDDRSVRAKRKEAEAELAAAEQDVALAELKKQGDAITLSRQELAVKAAKDDEREARSAYAAALNVFNEGFDVNTKLNGGGNPTEDQRKRRQAENPDLRRASALVIQAQNKVAGEEKQLDAARLLPGVAEANAKKAAAQVDGWKGKIEEADVAIEECVVRARVAGVVEQVVVTPGVTIGPATRGPLLWIIPTGGRVVRAEVEAEFASKIADKVNKKVTVYDHSNFALTYEGKVRQIGSAFLPKRSAAESLVGGQTRVLECLIDVPDPAPPGKPPLRVGQPVRVSFPDK